MTSSPLSSVTGRTGPAFSGAGRTFRPRLLAVLVLLSLIVLLGLGTWQLRRLAWKEALIVTASERLAGLPQRLPPAAEWPAWDFRRVAFSGSYRHEAAIAFGLSARGQQIGARLLTPFVLSDGRAVLVDRGWLAESRLPPNDPVVSRPMGPVDLDGVARAPLDDGRNLFTPADDPTARRVYGYNWPMLQRLTGLELLPIVLRLQAPDGPAGGPSPNRTVVDYRNPHLGYAVTWYGLAVTLAAVYVVFRRRQGNG